MNQGGHRRPTAAMVRNSWRRDIQQSANMLHNRPTLLNKKITILITFNLTIMCTMPHRQHHQHITLTSSLLPQRQRPIWCPPRRQTKTVHTDDVCMPPLHRKVLVGGKYSPPVQPSEHQQNSHRTCCYVDTAQHHQLTTPGTKTIQTEFKPYQINVMILVLAMGRVS